LTKLSIVSSIEKIYYVVSSLNQFAIERKNFVITSKSNPLIKRFRSFKDNLPAKEKGYFCIEGTHLIEEFLKLGINPLKIIATEEWLVKNNYLINHLDVEIISQVSKETLRSAVSTRNPDGVAAIVEKSSLKECTLEKEDDFLLVLDRIQDPGNLGNLFRTALAAGVNKVLLGGGASPFNQKVLRSSCGSIFHIPFRRIEGGEEEICDQLIDFLRDISKKRFQIVLAVRNNKFSKKTPKPYWEYNWSKPTALILGNEGSGIHNKIQEAFRETITIPHSELVESLNVACVAVPLLLERKRRILTSFSENKSD